MVAKQFNDLPAADLLQNDSGTLRRPTTDCASPLAVCPEAALDLQVSWLFAQSHL
jgi:hypothetical protein